MSQYGDQQSLTTVQTGSIQSRNTAIKVSAVLPGTETRNAFARLTLNTTEHPLPLTLSPIVFAPTELAVVDFDDLVRTADLLRAAQHVVQHDLYRVCPNQ